MWNRSEIKSYAKGFLSRNYWKSFLVVLITSFLLGGTSGVGNSSSNQDIQTEYNNFMNDPYTIQENFNSPSEFFEFTNKVVLSPLEKIGLGFAAATSIFAAILLVTLGFVAEVGQSRFFLEGFKGDVSISKVFSGFNTDEYFSIVKTQALANISIFLWTFLFIIPGIIKSYQYRYVPYLLAEDPNISSSEALDQSKRMTMGHKWDIFVLDLSFILWNMLGIITFGLAPLFVAPYKEATNARLYNILSSNENLDLFS